MSVASLLLRILLSVLLVFNGAAGAAAGVRMAGHGHGTPVAASMFAVPQADTSGCHSRSGAMASMQHAASKGADAGHADADCCQDRDACRCDCLHHASALMPHLEWRPLAICAPTGESAQRRGIATAPQRLPLRPPIV
jgi:hypothetical protein